MMIETFYSDLIEQCKGIVDAQLPVVSNLSNITSVVHHHYNAHDRHINWTGFYLAIGSVLYLGPFQGKVACTVIPFSKGVCGTCAYSKVPLVVPDVHAFPGHIACDGRSESELVIPILRGDEVIGVFDMDCLCKDGFHEADAACLTEIMSFLVDKLPAKSWI